MFLQLSAIVGPAKAILGQAVDTALGPGVVRSYSMKTDTYVINLGEHYFSSIESPHTSGAT